MRAPAYLDLSWSISPENDIAGYNIYRSEQEGAPGQKLNPAAVANSRISRYECDFRATVTSTPSRRWIAPATKVRPARPARRSAGRNPTGAPADVPAMTSVSGMHHRKRIAKAMTDPRPPQLTAIAVHAHAQASAKSASPAVRVWPLHRRATHPRHDRLADRRQSLVLAR